MCVTANSHYFRITESSQPPYHVIIQVKAGWVQQNKQLKDEGTTRPYPVLKPVTVFILQVQPSASWPGATPHL